MTVARMARAWLDHHDRNGTVNWDIPLMCLLGIVLITSLGARGGDVARASYYVGREFLQWGHITLYLLDGKPPRAENLKAVVRVHYAKGHKNALNEDHDVNLSPVTDPRYYHVCPIALLLIHAMRQPVVVDANRFLEKELKAIPGVEHISVGRA